MNIKKTLPALILLLSGNVMADSYIANKCGSLYVEGKYNESEPYCLKAAKMGEKSSQFYLGALKFGINKDYDAAYRWTEKSARQGVAEAQHSLGVMHAEGLGTPVNEKMALYWYEKAAEQGFEMSQHNLGVMHSEGRGTPVNYLESIYWYQKAADQGLADSQLNLGVAYGNGQGTTQNYETAIYWIKKAAEQENAAAQYQLGVIYSAGYGGFKDDKLATNWYLKAAKNGHLSAQAIIGIRYTYGTGIKKDLIKGAAWLFVVSYRDNNLYSGALDNTLSKMSRDEKGDAQLLAFEYIKQYVGSQ